MKSLVISGGGALGAWGGGVASILTEEGADYDVYIGTSTGALLVPMVALKKFTEIRKAYTSVSTTDIFSVNPFTKKGKINYFNAIWRILNGKSSLGESNNLRKLISKFFTESDFKTLKSINKEVVVCVFNITLNRIEYKSSNTESYEDFCDWMWISANVPLFMSTVEKNGSQYVDGGVAEVAGVRYAKDLGSTDIDVILHRNHGKTGNKKTRTVFDLFGNVVKGMMTEIATNDINPKNFEGLKSYRVFYMPFRLKANTIEALNFKPDVMSEWWNMGYSKDWILKQGIDVSKK